MKLRELIGEVTNVREDGYQQITETNKGCLTNVELYNEYRKFDWLDAEVSIYRYKNNPKLGEICLTPNIQKMYGMQLYAFFEEDNIKILSSFPGDERGCAIFGDVFISSGHDGNYLWNVKTGDYQSFSW